MISEISNTAGWFLGPSILVGSFYLVQAIYKRVLLNFERKHKSKKSKELNSKKKSRIHKSKSHKANQYGSSEEENTFSFKTQNRSHGKREKSKQQNASTLTKDDKNDTNSGYEPRSDFTEDSETELANIHRSFQLIQNKKPYRATLLEIESNKGDSEFDADDEKSVKGNATDVENKHDIELAVYDERTLIVGTKSTSINDADVDAENSPTIEPEAGTENIRSNEANSVNKPVFESVPKTEYQLIKYREIARESIINFDVNEQINQLIDFRTTLLFGDGNQEFEELSKEIDSLIEKSVTESSNLAADEACPRYKEFLKVNKSFCSFNNNAITSIPQYSVSLEHNNNLDNQFPSFPATSLEYQNCFPPIGSSRPSKSNGETQSHGQNEIAISPMPVSTTSNPATGNIESNDDFVEYEDEWNSSSIFSRSFNTIIFGDDVTPESIEISTNSTSISTSDLSISSDVAADISVSENAIQAPLLDADSDLQHDSEDDKNSEDLTTAQDENEQLQGVSNEQEPTPIESTRHDMVVRTLDRYNAGPIMTIRENFIRAAQTFLRHYTRYNTDEGTEAFLRLFNHQVPIYSEDERTESENNRRLTFSQARELHCFVVLMGTIMHYMDVENASQENILISRQGVYTFHGYFEEYEEEEGYDSSIFDSDSTLVDDDDSSSRMAIYVDRADLLPM